MSICNGRLNFSNLLESSIRLDSSCFGETAREISFFQCWHFPFFARSYLVQCSFVYLLFDHVAVVACARVLQVQGFFHLFHINDVIWISCNFTWRLFRQDNVDNNWGIRVDRRRSYCVPTAHLRWKPGQFPNLRHARHLAFLRQSNIQNPRHHHIVSGVSNGSL